MNLLWDALTTGAGHLREASAVKGEQWREFAAIGVEIGTNLHLPLHWRIPGLNAKLVGLTGRTLLTEQTVNTAALATLAAHYGYREAESAVNRWFSIGHHLLETGLVANHLIRPEGDKQLVYDWAAATAAIGLSGAVNVVTGAGLNRTSNGIAISLALVEYFDNNFGLLAMEMGRNEMVLTGETDRFHHEGDGTSSGYFSQMEKVAETGDLAVTVTEGPDGSKAYLVHLAGMDLSVDDLNRQDARGYLGLLDATRNDSQHLAGVVDEALVEMGAEPGDTIALSGYSMGAIGATNLVGNQLLQDKYDLRAAQGMAGPGQDKALPPGTRITHFQDRRDPVTHLLGEHHRASGHRLTIEYGHHSEVETKSLFGRAHSYQHHLEALEQLEARPEEYFTEEEQEHLEAFTGLYAGEAETVVFSAEWQPQEGVDAAGSSPWNSGELKELAEEGWRLVRNKEFSFPSPELLGGRERDSFSHPFVPVPRGSGTSADAGAGLSALRGRDDQEAVQQSGDQ